MCHTQMENKGRELDHKQDLNDTTSCGVVLRLWMIGQTSKKANRFTSPCQARDQVRPLERVSQQRLKQLLGFKRKEGFGESHCC
jgi:hypothetical protein